MIDGQNRRIGKRIDGVLTRAWLYKDQLKPIAELDGSGNLVARFIYGSKTNVPDVILRYAAGTVTRYRVISDHLGSPVMAVNVDNPAEVPFAAEYTAFGEMTVTSGASSNDWMPFGFAGGLYDADTELVRFGARDYDAVSGRWTAKDPILFAAGDTDLFGYVSRDPVNKSDPSGLETFVCKKPLNALGGTSDSSNQRNGPDVSGNPLYHQYICVIQGNHVVCGGQSGGGQAYGPGQPSNDTFETYRCEPEAPDNTCLESCLATRVLEPVRPWYGIAGPGTNC